MSNALVVRALEKNFPAFHLDHVSFELPHGYIMGLIGANGAGKTTTVRLIMNMLQRDGGTIEVLGRDNIAEEAAVKEEIAVVFETPPLVGDWTVRTACKSVSAFYKRWNQSQFDSYLQRFHIDPNKKVKELSRGMQTKLSLAMALCRDAKLLILDEPTSGLDPVSRSELLDILGEYIMDGQHSVFFSTHITTDLEKVADFITFLRQGKVAFSGTKDDFLTAFHLVKGNPRDLTPELERLFVGVRTYEGGFEGLITSEHLAAFQGTFLVEPPTIEEIMIYSDKGGEHHD